MGIREEVEDMKKEVRAVKEQTLMLDILRDYKKQNKRLFAIWIITFLAFIGLLSYTIYLLNDIGTEEITETTTQEIEDINSIDSSYIINGDNYGKD